MREIKFRAWDEKEKVMIGNDDIKKGFMNIQASLKLPRQFIAESGLYLPFGFAEYMQFTGLQDKNGVEIYEDDIIKHFEEIGIVKWYLDRFIINWVNEICFYREDLAYWTTERRIEVIGNIHENPELLKGE